ncbi:MAG TPA: sigma-54-dependent Fis family transcriptional regulator [Bacteroidales bacterium]|nr:sigma-54-dependent Fis family transcriptional regulator [Bacteroidales bacterium]
MIQKFSSSILIIDDNPDILTSAEMFLEENFSTIISESDPTRISSHINKSNIDIILLDMNFRKGEIEGYEGIFWLDKIKSDYPDMLVILMTAFGDVELAVKGIKKGAFDFITKPWKNAKLLATLISAHRFIESQREKNKFKNQSELLTKTITQNYSQVIGESPAINQLKETLQKVSETDANVLLLGKNGTGKELAARELHRMSNRKNEAFITVDLGAISETLFESEIFGHVKGAFTDAKADKPGRFELADKGTIFLDEIGNLSYNLQSKLLTVIQNKKLTRVGSSKEIPIDVRIICATNMPLKDMIEQGQFRQDLFYRINTFEINIPSLKDRIDDIPLLAEHFLNQYKAKYNKPDLKLDDHVIRQLKNYDWPGNIRELKNIVERATVLSEGKTLEINLQVLPLAYSSKDKDNSGNLNLDENEKHLIIQAIEKNNGNITKAAKELGIQRNALYRRIEKHGL